MVDHLHRDLAGLGRVEWAAGGGIERGPGGFVNFGAERALQLFVWVARTGEIGMADEKALAIVIRVNEPARDVVPPPAMRKASVEFPGWPEGRELWRNGSEAPAVVFWLPEHKACASCLKEGRRIQGAS
jgi:hypothetical protein